MRKWKILNATALGLMVGLGLILFDVSNAISYLSDDPEACVNCHIMNPQYATWTHSSHREKTNCNDCHVPHDNIVRKYMFKASDGLRHATVFTMRAEPQVIRINDAGITVVQENCKRCHIDQINPVSAANVDGHNYKAGEGKLCWDCHREVPHGKLSGQASTPFSRGPNLMGQKAEWMNKDKK
ncbi:MAG: cytochrome c nitrite reductase small subunit [Chlorobi bacterium]|nr:cytochrome c nitrite reductase small subunit [Chlorobiota bacterium]